MIKRTLHTILLSSLLTSAANIYAISNYDNDYDSALYQDEGRLLLKFRAFGAKANGKMTNPAATSAHGKLDPKKSGKFLASGMGGEAAAVLFFNDHIATELSLGLSTYRHKSGAMTAAAWNYGTAGAAAKKRSRLYMIPMAISMQYHVAPFGGVRPYVGAGYQYVYIHSSSKNFSTTNGHGPLAQVGMDFVMRDDTILNIDVRQAFYSAKIKYKNSMLGHTNTSVPTSKYKVNPLQIAVGIGMKF